MKKPSAPTKEQKIKNLKQRVSELQAELKLKQQARIGDEFLRFKANKMQVRFKRIKKKDEPDIGHGTFLMHVDITALQQTLYVPISIASSSKPTGFIYNIEGTAIGDILKAGISCRGDSVTKVRLGTLLYAKIPKGKTATFRMLIEIKGGVGKTYNIVIHRINYRFDPRDSRYQRLDTEIRSKTLSFR